MKKLVLLCTIYTVFLSLEGLATQSPEVKGHNRKPSSVSETRCSSDGCVMAKNSEFNAVIDYLKKNDDCMTATSWLQSLNRLGDGTYQVVCGDQTDRNQMTLKASLENNVYVVKIVYQN